MKIIFLLSSLHNIDRDKDTSFILMVAAQRRGHQVFYLANGGIIRKNGKTTFHVIEVVPQPNEKKLFKKHEAMVLTEEEVDIVFIRSDPPFNEQYLLNTWLLDLVNGPIKIINNPTGIRTANEKIWAMQFTSIIPPTFIGRHKQDMLNFLSEEKEIVAKPTDGFGGQSIFHIKEGDLNANVILETLTHDGTRDIILQKFIPEARQGDKRILLLNGEPLGALLRVHSPEDHRNNFFSGGKPVASEINQRDEEIINILKPELQKLGLYFVGIDIMGDYLIEVNVTSPTCLQEMNRLYDVQLEDKVMAFAEKL